MTMITSKIWGVIEEALPFVAMMAVVLATLKAIGLPVNGSVETWAWVAVACAAAKMAK